jgi:hypothetical protein
MGSFCTGTGGIGLGLACADALEDCGDGGRGMSGVMERSSGGDVMVEFLLEMMNRVDSGLSCNVVQSLRRKILCFHV